MAFRKSNRKTTIEPGRIVDFSWQDLGNQICIPYSFLLSYTTRQTVYVQKAMEVEAQNVKMACS